MRMTVGRKLVSSFLIISIMLGVSSLISYIEMKRMDSSYTDLLEREAILRFYAASIQGNVSQQTSSLRGYLLRKDQENLDSLKDADQKVQQLVEHSLQLAQLDEYRKLLQSMAELNLTYEKAADEVIAVADHDMAQAQKLAFEKVSPIGKTMKSQADQIVQKQVGIIGEAQKANKERMESVFQLLTILCIASFVVAVVIGLVVSHIITKPLGELSQAAKRMAGGDLTGQDVVPKMKDEIRELAESFNKMKQNLRELVGHVSMSVEQVAAASEELTASSEQTGKATEQITVSVQEAAAGVEKQLQSIREVHLIVGEISKGMDQAASSIQSSADAAVTASQETHRGNQVVAETMNQMNVVRDKVASTAGVVHVLGEKSQEIGRIVSLITAIANQTNLLSLNAAIEAARAGEHGRGFAVVADEVRKLAEQSARAAGEIRQLVEEIQHESQNAVRSMDEGTQAVEEGLVRVRHTGESFDTITRMIEEVSAQSQEVSAIVEEVNAGTQGMVGAVDSVAVISEQSSANTQQVASASEEQLASMEEIAASAGSLSRLVEQLRELVSQFKV